MTFGSFSPFSALTAEIDGALADADRVLRDRAQHEARVDILLLLLAQVEADQHELLARFLDADRRASAEPSLAPKMPFRFGFA